MNLTLYRNGVAGFHRFKILKVCAVVLGNPAQAFTRHLSTMYTGLCRPDVDAGYGHFVDVHDMTIMFF